MRVPSDPTERTLRAQLGAHTLHASRDLTAPARSSFSQRFLNEVDPSGTLAEVERLQWAKHALRSHMASLSLRSAQERRPRAEGAEAADLADLVVAIRASRWQLSRPPRHHQQPDLSGRSRWSSQKSRRALRANRRMPPPIRFHRKGDRCRPRDQSAPGTVKGDVGRE
jgi:hypothetical protein